MIYYLAMGHADVHQVGFAAEHAMSQSDMMLSMLSVQHKHQR